MVLARLEVIALNPADAAAAQAGGADQLLVLRDIDSGGLTPLVQTVRMMREQSALPIRVMLRAEDSATIGGSDLTRLQGAALEMAAAGADGFALGFLDLSLDIDTAAVMELLKYTSGLPWTFHRAFDLCLSSDRAWRQVVDLPACDTVLTAGSARDVEHGIDDLIARAHRDPQVAAMAMVGGGLKPDHIPWLVRAGIRQFHLGPQVRPAEYWKSHIDPAHVRSWRTLIDDAVALAESGH